VLWDPVLHGEAEAVQGFCCGVLLLLLPLGKKAVTQAGMISGRACGLCCTGRSGWFITVVPSLALYLNIRKGTEEYIKHILFPDLSITSRALSQIPVCSWFV